MFVSAPRELRAAETITILQRFIEVGAAPFARRTRPVSNIHDVRFTPKRRNLRKEVYDSARRLDRRVEIRSENAEIDVFDLTTFFWTDFAAPWLMSFDQKIRRCEVWVMANAVCRYALGLLILGVCAAPRTASANTIITPIFDSSITSLSNASSIEAAFDRVAADYSSVFANPLNVHIQVSWGSVNGSALPSNALGSSNDPLYGYFTYAQVKSALTSFSQRNPSDTALASVVKNLPLYAPSDVTRYAIPSAEAKALGLVSPNSGTTDGYIGFAGSTSNYDFDPSNGIASGTYDFEAVAAHEMAEVLGRISGLSGTNPGFRTPLDLMRYSAPGQLGFSYNQAAYFSIDGGKTNLGNFNNSTSGGDRSDWLTLVSSTDIQDAFIYPGRNFNLSFADLAMLDALGWGGSNVGDTSSGTPNGTAFALVEEVPEPSTLAVFGLGLIGLAFAMRRTRSGQHGY